MNYLKLFLLSIILIGCKKKTFADDIVLINNSTIEMKFQKFNEGIDEYGSSIIYIGNIKDSIPIKYYDSLFPPPPRPIGYLRTLKEINDSIIFSKLRDKYFHGDFERIKFSDQPVKFDSLTHNLLEIVVKPNDTIPHFVIDSARSIKAYKSFPVFLKNISGKKLKMVVDNFPGFAILNANKKWQIIRNNSFYICGDAMYNQKYWVLNPDEIIVYAVNHFHGKHKAHFKIGLTPTFFSEEFEGNIDPKIIEKQRDAYFIK
jgi:hypothetical protein